MIELRPEVQQFAEWMETELRKNDHKGGAGLDDAEYVTRRLREEVDELAAKLTDLDASATEVCEEAADVANFAMFAALLAAKEVGDSLALLLDCADDTNK